MNNKILKIHKIKLKIKIINKNNNKLIKLQKHHKNKIFNKLYNKIMKKYQKIMKIKNLIMNK